MSFTFGPKREVLVPIECPRCGAVNPETSRRCDCGQDLSAVAAQVEERPREGGVPQQSADDESRRCAKCGGPLEAGFLYGIDSVGETAQTRIERVGWMAGDEIQKREERVLWVIKVPVETNPRRQLTASRCAS